MTAVHFYVVCFKTHVGVSLIELALFFRDPAVSGYPNGSQLPFLFFIEIFHNVFL